MGDGWWCRGGAGSRVASHTARARRDPPRRARDCQRHRSAAWRRAAAGGEWGVGSGEWGREAGGGGSSGGQGPTPWGSRRPTIDPSQRKIAPRRAAQPLRHQERGGVGAGPHEIERRRRKLAQNGKNDLENFLFLAFLAGFSGAPRLQKRPARPEPRGSASYIGGAKRAIGGLGAEGSGPSVTGVAGPLNPSG